MRLQRLFIRKLQLFLALLVITFSLAFGQHDAYFTPPDDPLLGIADSLSGIGDFEGAFEKLKQYEKSLPTGVDVKTQTFVKLKLAEALLFGRDKEQAEEFIERAKSLLKGNNDLYLESEFYFVQAKYFTQVRKADKAIEYASKAIEIKESIFPGDVWGLGKCYYELAEINRRLLYDDRLTVDYLLKTESKIGVSPDYPRYQKALCYYHLSSKLRERGKLLTALSYAKKATITVESLGIRQLSFLSFCYNLRANAHFYLEEYDLAISYYKEALIIADKNNIKGLVDMHNNLGVNYHNLGDFEKAINQYNLSLQLLSEADTIDFAGTYSKIGEIYLDLGKLDSAFFYLDQSLSLIEKWYLEETYEIANCHNLLGKYHSQVGNNSRALEHFHKSIVAEINEFDNDNIYSLPSARQITNTSYNVEKLLADKAGFMAWKGIENKHQPDLDHALSLYRLIDTIYAQKTEFLEIETELHDISHIHQTYGDAILLISHLYQKSESDDHLQLAFEYLERVKARILLNKLVSLKNAYQLNLPDSLIKKEQQLAADLDEVLFAIKNVGVKAKDSLDLRLTSLITDQGILRKNIEQNYPDYYQKRYEKQKITIGSVQNYLSEQNSHLLQYFWAENAIHAMYITKNRITLKTFDLSKKLESDLDDYLKMLRLNLTSQDYSRSVEKFSNAASGIYQNLLAPFFSNDPPENLIIIPDGILSKIPFEALLTDETYNDKSTFFNLPYFIRKTSISYAYSVTTLLNSNQNKQSIKKPSILTFSYSDDTTLTHSANLSNLPELPGAFDEFKAIKTTFKDDFMGFKGYDASKANFLDHFQNYDIIHLGLHAESDLSVRQNSRIYFRPTENSDSSQHLLYAHDIYHYPLNNRLVFLSACETGQGKYYTGEGIYSIARGFSYAGVPSVILSLWKLGDQSGASLIPDYYKSLKDGQRIDHALQTAKLKYLEKADEISAHPANWAALVSLGEQRPISSKNYLLGIWSLIAVSFILLFVSLVYWIRKKLHQNVK